MGSQVSYRYSPGTCASFSRSKATDVQTLLHPLDHHEMNHLSCIVFQRTAGCFGIVGREEGLDMKLEERIEWRTADLRRR